MRIEMGPDEIIKLFGPMSVEVVSGAIYVLGKTLGSGDTLVVPRSRSYPVLSLEASVLDIRMGEDAAIHDAEKDEPLRAWISAAREMVSASSVMVLGGVDSGKSSFTTLLANEFFSAGKKTCVLDTDIGQADIGPPGFVSLAVMDKPVLSLRELRPAAMRLVGDIRPQYVQHRILMEAARLARYSLGRLGCEALVIDTDGWVREAAAVSYKSRLIEELLPENLVVLGDGLGRVFRRYEKLGLRLHVLPSPRVLRARSRDARRMLRGKKYSEFLEDAGVRAVSLDDVVLLYLAVFEGAEIPGGEVSEAAGARVLYASWSPDTLYIVTDEQVRGVDELKARYGVQRIRFVKPGFERGLYVAVSDGGVAEYPGVVESIDFAGRRIRVRTLWEGPVKIIKFSRIRLLDNYVEQIVE